VAVLPVKAHGQLGQAKTVQQHTGASADPQRQTSPHPHCIALDPENRYAWVPDLGTDSIWCYAYDPVLGALLHQPERTVRLPPGSGPRLLKFHPDGVHAYLLNEIANTLVSYRYHDYQLQEIEQQSTLSPGLEERNSADLQIHHSGRSLYVSNRTQHSISVFSINCTTGAAKLIQQVQAGGQVPRSMAQDPTGRTLLVGNEADDSIEGFRIAAGGELQPLGCVAEMPGPASLIFVEV
jgi:6-phosphogluconolactonase